MYIFKKIILIAFIFIPLLAMQEKQNDSWSENLIHSILHNAQEILSENPHFNNRDLIREFFFRYPQYTTPVEINSDYPSEKQSKPKKIAIIGGGPSGLLAAFALAREGHHIEVYEKRSQGKFDLRWQNISINVPELIVKEFTELDAFLKSEQLIQYEMELDNPKKLRSYRIAIGDLQNALVHLCKKYSVCLYYERNTHIDTLKDTHIVLLATGANTLTQHKYHKLADAFNFKHFPEYKTHGIAAMSYEPETQFSPGLIKERIGKNHNINWGFKVTLVGNGVETQRLRLSRFLSDTKLDKKYNNPAVIWYLYAMKDSIQNLPFSENVDIYSRVDFVPSLAAQGVILYHEKPIIIWGDARTSAHPLTGASMTIPFRSIKPLCQLVKTYDSDVSSFEKYNQQTQPLALELFIKTVLVTLF